MAYTDEQLAAMGGQVDEVAPVRVRAPKGTPGKPGRVKDVPLSTAAYESTLAPVRSRLGALGQATGVDFTPEGIVLDHDASTALTEGEDPEVRDAIRAQLAYDTRKGDTKSDKSALEAFFTGDPHEGGKRFPEFNKRFGGFVPEDTTRREAAQKAYDRAHLFITKQEEGTSPVPEDVDKYLIASSDSPARKAYVRKLIADRFREEARKLPAQGGGAELAAQARKVADYIETLNPELLAPSARTGTIVKDLTKHVSPPVARAIKTSLGDALLTGFGNNVAPITMGLGSMIAKAPGLGNNVRAPGADVIYRNPETGLEETHPPGWVPPGGDQQGGEPVGIPGTRAASGTVGQNVEMMHQAIVEGLTGKSPEEQAAWIDQLKREHPVAYHAAAVAGWLADPIGLLGGKAVQGLRAAGKAGLGAAATPAAITAVGAPTGVVAGRAAGSENDALNAGLGIAGEGLGQLAGAGIGKLAKVAAGAPKRIAQEEINQSARVIAHDLGQLEARHGIKGTGTTWEQVYAKLRHQYPDLPATLAQKANPLNGQARPSLVPELAHAADVVTAHAEAAPTAAQAATRPFVTLTNPNATNVQVLRDVGREFAEGRGGRALMAAAVGRAGAAQGTLDKGVAKLVQAIRGGNLEAFQAAVREAHGDGISPAMIDAATEAFHRRNKGHR